MSELDSIRHLRIKAALASLRYARAQLYTKIRSVEKMIAFLEKAEGE